MLSSHADVSSDVQDGTTLAEGSVDDEDDDSQFGSDPDGFSDDDREEKKDDGTHIARCMSCWLLVLVCLSLSLSLSLCIHLSLFSWLEMTKNSKFRHSTKK